MLFFVVFEYVICGGEGFGVEKWDNGDGFVVGFEVLLVVFVGYFRFVWYRYGGLIVVEYLLEFVMGCDLDGNLIYEFVVLCCEV